MSTKSPEPPVAAAPLLTRRPWEVLGISRPTWYRLRSSGSAPLPVDLGMPTCRPQWRVADLLKWIEGRKADRTIRKGPTRRPKAEQPAA